MTPWLEKKHIAFFTDELLILEKQRSRAVNAARSCLEIIRRANDDDNASLQTIRAFSSLPRPLLVFFSFPSDITRSYLITENK